MKKNKKNILYSAKLPITSAGWLEQTHSTVTFACQWCQLQHRTFRCHANQNKRQIKSNQTNYHVSINSSAIFNNRSHKQSHYNFQNKFDQSLFYNQFLPIPPIWSSMSLLSDVCECLFELSRINDKTSLAFRISLKL